ncbi:DUF4350 domain-containing protein [Snodgrassella sp. CFCC 13594]|uniref:DUF4350 domain-containing protein n=1 Tax=Snodgrassella sp. CFCC 13594 TaxID=1775559 RepID=UPI00082D6F94|nr:DUF4350 domain-containing protein [Snodgrassella sp. CFCC 13594]
MNVLMRYKWLCLLLGLVVVMLFVVSANVHKESRQRWVDNTGWRTVVDGQLYGLQQWYQHTQANTPLKTYRQWTAMTDDKKSFTQVGQLLFVENSTAADAATYQALLRWVARGNHVVLPMPLLFAHEQAQDGEKNTQKNQGIDESEFKQWLWHNWRVQWVKQAQRNMMADDIKSAAAQACQSDWQGSMQARIQVGDAPLPLDVAEQLNCNKAFNQIVLPEGAALAWVDSAPSSFQWAPNAPVIWAGNGYSGSHIVRVAYGRGSVVLLSSIQPLSNPDVPNHISAGLDRFDHAYLADYLAQDKSRIVLLRYLGVMPKQTDAPAWWRLWLAQPVLMQVLLVGVLLLLWFLAQRVGAIHRQPHADTPDWTHYLDMQGRFLGHHGSRRDAVAEMQTALWQQWQRRWPDWSRIDANTKIARLQHAYESATRQHVLRWLAPVAEVVSEQDWLRYVQAHQCFQATNNNNQKD